MIEFSTLLSPLMLGAVMSIISISFFAILIKRTIWPPKRRTITFSGTYTALTPAERAAIEKKINSKALLEIHYCFWKGCTVEAVEVFGTRFNFCEKHGRDALLPKSVDVKFHRAVEVRFDFAETYARGFQLKKSEVYEKIGLKIPSPEQEYYSYSALGMTHHVPMRGNLPYRGHDEKQRCSICDPEVPFTSLPLLSTGKPKFRAGGWLRRKRGFRDLVKVLSYNPDTFMYRLEDRDGSFACMESNVAEHFEPALPRKGEWWMRSTPKKCGGAGIPHGYEKDQPFCAGSHFEPKDCCSDKYFPVNFGRGEQSPDPTEKKESTSESGSPQSTTSASEDKIGFYGFPLLTIGRPKFKVGDWARVKPDGTWAWAGGWLAQIAQIDDDGFGQMLLHGIFGTNTAKLDVELEPASPRNGEWWVCRNSDCAGCLMQTPYRCKSDFSDTHSHGHYLEPVNFGKGNA